jgi:hypothetical protein
LIFTKTRQFAGLWALCIAVGAAQAPVVPTDHYGPPVCNANSKPVPAANRTSVEKSLAIQEAGANDPTAILAAEPMENFDIARMRIRDYMDCAGKGGCYWADLDTQYKRAEAALNARVAAKKPGEKLAMVFDIDETVLSKYCQFPVEDYGYLKAIDDIWTVSPEAAVRIPGALRLFNQAKAEGVTVFFITGRPGIPAAGAGRPQDNQRPPTERNLKAAGFDGWTGLALKDGEENKMPVSVYKPFERRKIVEKGYKIVMNVGDQWSDLNGEPHAEVNVKLPNPFYFLP